MANKNDMGRIVGGASLIFIGNIVGMILGFLTRILPARLLSPQEYGVFILGITIVTVVGLFAHLGMVEGIGRNVPRSSEPSKTFILGAQMALLSGILIAILTALTAPIIAPAIASSNFIEILIIFSISIPFFVIFKICIAGFQGVEDSIGKVVLETIFRTTVILLIALCIFFFNTPSSAAVGWTVGLLITAFSGVLLVSLRTNLLNKSFKNIFQYKPLESKSLLIFSLPLMVATSARRFMQETDTILIGYFLPGSESVGIYDSAFTIARGLFILLWTFGFLFLPIWSRLHKNNEHDEMKQKYHVISKWIGVFTLPAFLIVVTFPETILTTVFGVEYQFGKLSLQILAIGFFLHTLIGPNRVALTAVGDSRFILKSTVAVLIANLVLNIILIPQFGIVGAAISTVSTYLLLNLSYSTRLYHKYKITPVTKNSITLYFICLILFSVTYLSISNIVSNQRLLMMSIIIIYGILHFAVYTVVGIEEAERDVGRAVLKRLPITNN